MFQKNDAGMTKMCILLCLMFFSWQQTLAQDSLRYVIERHADEYMATTFFTYAPTA